MKLVIHLSHANWAVGPEQYASVLAEVGEAAEAAGVDGIAVADHLWQHPIMGGPEASQLEGWTALAFLAAHTSTVRLFTLATGAHFRHPAVLAKTVSTVDVLSGGRTWLGIGSGHYEEECTGLGVAFPDVATRTELLEDALEVCTRMWSGDEGGYDGHHVHAERLLDAPGPLHRPGILVAGTGPRRTLPLVARYADACSLRPGPEIPDQLARLRRLCDEAGTDADRIEVTCAYAFSADGGDDLVDQLRWLAGLGVETVIGRLDGDDPRPVVDHLGRHVVPAVAELEAAA
jgi:alkanesulfonate monooxygenase SsuD/methylene tetrahydromethanopterin reductase-like flavin-dependent oxidoreductase (luciferase family)